MTTAVKIAIIGAGPAGLTCGLALARRGIDINIFERGPNHLEAATYNPNRSYTIDITGHGKKPQNTLEQCNALTKNSYDFAAFNTHYQFGQTDHHPRQLPSPIEDRAGLEVGETSVGPYKLS